MRTALFLSSCLLLVACGDDDGAPDAMAGADSGSADSATGDGAADDGGADGGATDDGGAITPAERLCNATEAHTRCGETPAPRADCLTEQSCTATFLSAEAIEAIATCNEELACMTSDDGCFDATMLGLEVSAATTAYNESCTARLAVCRGEGMPFLDDFCFLNVATDAAIELFDGCLSSDCADISACMIAIATCE